MIRRRLLFIALALIPLAAQSEDWIQREISRPITSYVYREDFRAKGWLDILVLNDRTIQYYPQEPRNYYSSQPSQTLEIPPYYIYYDLIKKEANTPIQMALMSHQGVDVLLLKDTKFTSPPVSLIKNSLFLPKTRAQFDRKYFCRCFDSPVFDDFVVPDQSSFKIYMADDYSTPALRIPFDVSFFSVSLNISIPPMFGSNSSFRIGILTGFEQRGLYDNFYFYSTSMGSSHKLIITDATENRGARLEICNQIWEWQNGKWVKREQQALKENSLPEDDATSDTLFGEDSFSYKHHFDFNQDGIKDSVVFDTQASTFSPSTTVKVFLARADGTLPPKPTSEVRTVAVSPFMSGVPIMDVDGDGFPDLILFNPDTKGTSVSSNLKNFLKQGISGKLMFYLWDKDKGLPKSPTFSFPARITPEWVNYISPADNYLNVGVDMTGDGKPDMLLKTGAREYSLFAFINRQKGFSPKAAYIFKLPEKADSFILQDMNGDGLQDIIFTCHDFEKQISLDVIYFSNIK